MAVDDFSLLFIEGQPWLLQRRFDRGECFWIWGGRGIDLSTENWTDLSEKIPTRSVARWRKKKAD